MNNIKRGYTTSSIAYLLLGLALLIWPAHSLRLVCYLFGGVILLKGVTSVWAFVRSTEKFFFSYFSLIFGIIACAFGLFLLIKPDIVVSVLPFLVGIFILLDGFVRLQSAFELRRAGMPNWWSFLALAAFSALLGIVIAVNPFETVEFLVMAIGTVLLVEGILNLASSFYAGRVLRTLSKTVESIGEDLGIGSAVSRIDPEDVPPEDGPVIDVPYKEVDDNK